MMLRVHQEHLRTEVIGVDHYSTQLSAVAHRHAHKSMTSPKRSGVNGLIKIFAHKEDKEFYSFVNVNLYGQMNNLCTCDKEAVRRARIDQGEEEVSVSLYM